MKTLLTDDPIRAAGILRDGGLVAFPTETVYGLGANALDAGAVAGIFRAKGRPSDNPLIVHLASAEDLDAVAAAVPDAARAILDAFAPGPVTVVVPRGAAVPESVSAGLDTVGVRVPAHETAHRFLEACGVPVAAPSANRSGRPSPTTWEAVLRDLDGRIDCLLRGPRARVGLESTVVDCTVRPPVVLRAGSVTVEALRAAIGPVATAGADTDLLRRSPGTRHPHYAPDAQVRIVDHPGDLEHREGIGFIGTETPPDGYAAVCLVADPEAYAHELYDFFRRCDALGLRMIACQRIPEQGIGHAVMDRIRRASAGR